MHTFKAIFAPFVKNTAQNLSYHYPDGIWWCHISKQNDRMGVADMWSPSLGGGIPVPHQWAFMLQNRLVMKQKKQTDVPKRCSELSRLDPASDLIRLCPSAGYSGAKTSVWRAQDWIQIPTEYQFAYFRIKNLCCLGLVLLTEAQYILTSGAYLFTFLD